MEGNPIEITTFRVDSEYLDNRHPSKVEFTRSLEEDLARRDFTVNALAFSEKRGIIDIIGGKSDLEHGIIRCVRDPDERFGEDALRIMRALRFASCLGFEIEEKTAGSIHKNHELLRNVSVERLSAELSKLLCGKSAPKILLEYHDVISVLIPELAVLKGFEQHHFRHDKDVLGHTAAVLENAPPVLHIRLAALLHDIVKPKCFSLDESGTGHFYGHAPLGAEIAERILSRLKYDNETKSAVRELIRRHEDRFDADPKPIKRILNKIGFDMYSDLLSLMQADDMGKKEEYRPAPEFYEEYRNIAKEIIAKNECFSVKDLAIKGGDLIAIGIKPSPEMGKILDFLLEKVMDGEIPNEKEKLIEFVKSKFL